MVIGEEWIDRRLRRKAMARVHDRPHEIPWNCIFLSDEDSADDLNIKDRLLFFTALIPRPEFRPGSERPRVKQSYRWFFRYRLPSPPPRKTARNESDRRGQRSKRSPSFGSAIFQFSKSNYLTIRRSKDISLKLAIRFKNGDEGNSR